jgi:hypothetical protein
VNPRVRMLSALWPSCLEGMGSPTVRMTQRLEPIKMDDEQLYNLRAFTCTHVRNNAPILCVFHERAVADWDAGWTFHCGAMEHEDSEIVVTRLTSMLRIDPSIGQLMDLPIGTGAWRRTPSEDWTRHLLGTESDGDP